MHGCASELLALLELAQAQRVYLVGDLFTKGPDPVGVWNLIRAHKLKAVLGNHDRYLLDRPERFDWLTPKISKWVGKLPLTREIAGCVLVHAGLHPTLGIPCTTEAIATRVRRWPDDTDSANPFWYDAGWQGPQCVVFGHDARRGLVRREGPGGAPIAIGLDTGCVYGGKLSGWLMEEDRVVQVEAERVYRAI